MFPGGLEDREKGNLALMRAQMTTTCRPICGRLAWMVGDTRCMSFRVRGAAGDAMDAEPMDVLVKFVV